MDEKVIERLAEIVGSEFVLTAERIGPYLYDQTEACLRPKASRESVVVRPSGAREISDIMKLANAKQITVVVRGGGTGLCGAAIPIMPSIVISMERMKRIIEVDEKNFIITLESGVTLREMNDYLKKNSIFYFPSHSGDENAQLGGLVAENAGGVKSGKHGVMRNNIRGLEVVLPTGEIVQLNGKLQKNNAGYDLMQLVIGSEGTLCVVTKVMLRLYPEPRFNGTILVSFANFDQATDASTKILQTGVVPLAIEYLDRTIARKTADFLHEDWPLKRGKVDLLFVMAEDNEDALFNVGGIIEEICSSSGAVESVVLDGRDEQERILNIRNSTYYATKPYLADTLDITVPPASIPGLMKGFNSIAGKYGAVFDTVGHVGDGNVHNNIYLVNDEIPVYYEEMKAELYALAIGMGGTITGEHGIGKTRRRNLAVQLDETQVDLMRGIKKLFDPNNILNPETAII
ncbi:FAD-binding oxidoreductase [Bacilliculturomica massiliensis]|uniref:FAD-binding oxidoreductase n=1 Tax=Bacilliculturomica massiliensis TaxID=1917867 RepID=UPI00102F611F|nr:FAD-binding oxidoreductase [Bacilliculturomica massiliensis]